MRLAWGWALLAAACSSPGGGTGTTGAGGTANPSGPSGGGDTCHNGVKDGKETDVDCGGGVCDACDQGQRCLAVFDCKTSHCVDSVCCDTACTGTCVACTGAKTGGKDGACTAAMKGTDPKGQCPAAAAATCGNSGGCNGDAQSPGCAQYDATTVCQPAQCKGPVAAQASNCAGGSCPAPQTTSCSPYLCDPQTTSCANACGKTIGCDQGFLCASGQCLAFKSCGAVNADDQYNPKLKVGNEIVAFELGGGLFGTTLAGVEVFTGGVSGVGTLAVYTSSLQQPAMLLAATSYAQAATPGWQGAAFAKSVFLPAMQTYFLVWAPPPGSLANQELVTGTMVPTSVSQDSGKTWSAPQKSPAKLRLYCGP